MDGQSVEIHAKTDIDGPAYEEFWDKLQKKQQEIANSPHPKKVKPAVAPIEILERTKNTANCRKYRVKINGLIREESHTELKNLGYKKELDLYNSQLDSEQSTVQEGRKRSAEIELPEANLTKHRKENSAFPAQVEKENFRQSVNFLIS